MFTKTENDKLMGHYMDSGYLFVMEDGETILPYDVCGQSLNFYDPNIFEYVGRGVICCANGTPQNFSLDNPDHLYNFYRRK
jgi:hypothetical protein